MFLTPCQSIIARDLHRFRVLRAGRRFGKTTLLGEEIKGKAISKPRTIAYFATTYQQARDILWGTLKREMAQAAKTINESRLEIRCRTVRGGESIIYLRGWENVETSRGQAFDFLAIDEVDSMRNFQLQWQEVLRPTLTDTKGEGMFIGTPKGYRNMYNLCNLELSDKDYKSFHFTTYDNPHIPIEEIEKAKLELTEDRFAQEYLAEFRKTEGLVYKEFDRERHVYDDNTKIYDPVETIAGVDWGFTNPTAVPTIVKDYIGNFWVTDEYYKEAQTESQVAEYVSVMRFNKVYADPEAPSAIKELRLRGVNVREVIKNKDSISNGINKIKELLKANRLHIHKRCINTILEFETYSYPDKEDLQNPKEIPIDENNHMMDALRYAIYMQPIEGEKLKAHTYIPSNIIRQPQSLQNLNQSQPEYQEKKTAYTYIPSNLKR